MTKFTKFSFILALTLLWNLNTLKAQTGAALNFDGINDRVNLGTAINIVLAPQNKITIEAWVKPSSLTGNGIIAGNYGTPAAQMQFLLRRDANVYTFWIGNGNIGNFLSVTSLATSTLNVWQHVAGVYNGTVASIYINGILSATAAISYTFGTTTNSLVIGGAGGEHFTGDIDEVKIWTRNLSQSEIQNNMNCEINTPGFGLLANYHFNQGIAAAANPTVTALIDGSGNAYTGTLTNIALTAGSISNWVAPGGVVTGVSCDGAALNFDGSNDRVNLGTAINIVLAPQNKITAEAWVKPSTLGGNGIIAGNYGTPVAQMQFLLRRDGNVYTFWIGNGNIGNFLSVTSLATSTLNVWQHVAGVYNGTVASIYINGILSATAAISYTFGTTTNSLVIGGAGGEHFTGDIDEVRIWNRALCQGEIQNNINAEIPTTAPGLLANYHFNQGIAAHENPTVTTLMDASGNAYTGTLTNIALISTVSNWVKPGGVVSGSSVTAFVSPTVSIAGTNSICSGSSTTLTASGNVSTYVWVAGPTTASYAITPTITTTYSVTGTNSLGCVSALVTETVIVNANPTITVNSGSVCSGSAFTMAPNGASTYTFQGGNAVVSATANTSYTVVGTSTAGCVSQTFATSNVTVAPNPTVTAVTNMSLICVGQSATLTASGANTYTFNPGGVGANVTVSPTITSTYTVTGTAANGCSNSSSITQSVSACTGLIQIANSNIEFNVYPNPGNGIYSIEVLSSNMNITVIDVLGRIVYSQQIQNGKYDINLANLNNGLYILKAESNGAIKTVRLIKE